MRPRISIRGSVRPSVRPSVLPSVRRSVTPSQKPQKTKDHDTVDHWGRSTIQIVIINALQTAHLTKKKKKNHLLRRSRDPKTYKFDEVEEMYRVLLDKRPLPNKHPHFQMHPRISIWGSDRPCVCPSVCPLASKNTPISPEIIRT